MDIMQLKKEAPFQLHLSEIIRNYLNIYTWSRNENYYIDLEKNITSNESTDISISYRIGNFDNLIALELKFLKEQNSASSRRSIDCYIDIHRLEKLLIDNKIKKGYFILLTDAKSYTEKSKDPNSITSVFSLHDGHLIEGSISSNKKTATNSLSKKYNDRLYFEEKYPIEWTTFLHLTQSKNYYYTIIKVSNSQY